MSPKAVRITLWCTGTISCLVLLLYLPVLIWSPPWASEGYYDKDIAISPTHDYIFTPVHFTNNRIIYIMVNNHGKYSSSEYECIKLPDHWQCITQVHEELIIQTDFNVNSSEIIGTATAIHRTNAGKAESFLYPKIYSPFTLWYIKWLEWTAE